MTPSPNSTSAVQAWIGIAATAAPEVIAFVKALVTLKKKYPAMSTADLQAAVASITVEADTAFDDTLAKITADELAHPSA